MNAPSAPQASPAAGAASLFRAREPNRHHRVTFVELFFDLVFVFAVTQLSHRLLETFTPLGAFETLLLLLAVWWVWVYTCWVTNWLDPERPAVRLMLFGLMLAGLGLSTSIPAAFEERGIVFASTYAAIQVGRTAFMRWSIPSHDVILRENFTRILAWLGASGPVWIWGALLEGRARLAVWMIALGIEYVGPVVRFWTPGLGASEVRDWAVEGGHIAERCGLFIIIALGESVLVTGASFADCVWTPASVTAFASSFVGTVAMWWIYFDKGAEAGVERITHAEDPGRLARLAYTYLHIPIVAGVILSAVGDELVLAHPTGHVELRTAISLVGAPLLYLGGAVLFKHAMRGWYQPSHLAGIATLVLTAPFASQFSPLSLSVAVSLVLVVVAVWETRSLTGAT